MAISRDFYSEGDNYYHVEFNQDRKLPDFDLNDLQKITKTIVKRLGEVVLRSGSIINGEASILSNDGSTAQVGVQDGLIAHEGILVPFIGATLTYDLTTTPPNPQYVYVELTIKQITATQDGRLTLPTTGEPTANRWKYEAVLTTVDRSNDPLATGELLKVVYPIYEFDYQANTLKLIRDRKSGLDLSWLQGKLPMDRVEGIDTIFDEIARRFYNTHGSYITGGFETEITNIDAANGTATVRVNPGTAYIKGIEHVVETATDLDIPLALDTNQVLGELKTYTVGTRRYRINRFPVELITQINAVVEVTETVTRGSTAGGQDPLSNTPVVQIVSVTQGSTTYQEGTDYILTGNSVDWSPAGIEPAAGTTYEVVYRYNKLLAEPADYRLNGYFGDTRAAGTYYYFISAVDSGGLETVFDPDRIITVTVGDREIVNITWDAVGGAAKYRVYLATASPDVNTSYELLAEVASTQYIDDGLDTTTATNPISSGDPNEWAGQRSPLVTWEKLTDSADYIVLNPNIAYVDGTNISYDYNVYLNRIDAVYIDQNGVSIKSGTPGTNKPPLLNVDEVPISLVYLPAGNRTGDPYVIDNQLRSVKYKELQSHLEDFDRVKRDLGLTIAELDLYNKSAVTPTSIFTDDFVGEPWVDENHPDYAATIDVQEGVVTHDANFNIIELDNFTNLLSTTRGSILPYTEVVVFNQDRWSRDVEVNPFRVLTPPPATIECSCTTPLAEWVRSRFRNFWWARNLSGVVSSRVNVRGYKFNPSATATIFMDGVAVASTLTSSSGNLSAQFNIPNSVQAGSITVRAEDNGIPPGIAETSLRLDSEVVLRGAIRPWLISRWGVNTLIRGLQSRISGCPSRVRLAFGIIQRQFDPVAYSFSFDHPLWLTGVGVYFTAVDSNDIPVVIEIREMEGGFPSNRVVTGASVYPSDITLNAETKVTFAPVRLEPNKSYCIVIASDSNEYKVQIGKLGDRDQNNVPIINNLADGVLFLSPNGKSWVIDPEADLRVKIYGADFGSQVVEEITNVTNTLNFTHFRLLEETILFPGTDVTYEYRLSATDTWKPIAELVDLDGINNYLDVRIRLTATQWDTPVLFSPPVAVLVEQQLNGTYVSRMLELDRDVTGIELYAHEATPTGTSVTWYASNDDGKNWVALSRDTTYNKLIDGNTGTYERRYTGTFSTGNNRIRLKAVMNSSTYSNAAQLSFVGATFN